MFGETLSSERPDGADLLFGGTGGPVEIARNSIGDATEDATTHVITTPAGGNARDADTILGDNGDIHRLVGVTIAGTVRRAGSAA